MGNKIFKNLDEQVEILKQKNPSAIINTRTGADNRS